MRCRLMCLLTVMIAGSGQAFTAGAEPAKPWKAGAAKVKITPFKPMWMSGYSSRDKPAERALHDLWAKAVAIEDGDGRRIVLITMDLVGIPRDISQLVCADIAKKHNLPRESICLSVSHTHCGPVVGSNLNAMYFLDVANQQLVLDYAVFLRDKLNEAANAAISSLAPAEISWANGRCSFAVNRRNNKEADIPQLRDRGQLKGPIDHDVPVLSVRDKEGKVRAVVFGYACHATVLSFFQWCGDYPGFAQIALEQAYPDSVALFFAGCGADQNPLPRRKVELAEEYGNRLARSVRDVLESAMHPVHGNIDAQYVEIKLPFADLPSREQLLKDSMDEKNRYVAARAKMLLKQLDTNGSLSGTYPYPVQTWRIGPELSWVTLGGEVVVDYSLRLKKELGRDTTWVMGYANDVMAYIPSLRVLKEGGYEGAGSMIYYGLPTVWGMKVEEMIVTAVHDQIRKSQQERVPAK